MLGLHVGNCNDLAIKLHILLEKKMCVVEGWFIVLVTCLCGTPVRYRYTRVVLQCENTQGRLMYNTYKPYKQYKLCVPKLHVIS